MVKLPCFQRGDIVSVTFNDIMWRKKQKIELPALVLSTKEFNQLGTVLVAPITQVGSFAREMGFTVSLSSNNIHTHGVVLINHIRMLDLTARSAKIIENVPKEVIDESLAILQAIID